LPCNTVGFSAAASTIERAEVSSCDSIEDKGVRTCGHVDQMKDVECNNVRTEANKVVRAKECEDISCRTVNVQAIRWTTATAGVQNNTVDR
jgi:hypothetical protein